VWDVLNVIFLSLSRNIPIRILNVSITVVRLSTILIISALKCHILLCLFSSFLQLWILCFVIEIKESFNSKDYYHRHNLRPNDNHCFQLCNSLKIESTNYFTVTLILSLFGFCLSDVSIYFTIFKAKCN
jgi:hypothetical protein